MLRASGNKNGKRFDLEALAGDARSTGVAHGAVLVRFVDAVLEDSDEDAAEVREELRAALGDDGLVDVAGVVATFSQMDRIADGTGIPLDGPLEMATAGLAERIGTSKFASARNTPSKSVAHRVILSGLARLMRPVEAKLLSLAARLRG